MFSASGTNPLLICCAEGDSVGIQLNHSWPVSRGTGTMLKVYGGALVNAQMKLNTSPDTQQHLPFQLAASIKLCMQHHKQDIFTEALLIAFQKHLLLLTACVGQVAHSASPDTYYCTQQIPGVGSLGYTQVRNIIRSVYQSTPSCIRTCAHSMLPWWSQPHMHINVLLQEDLFAMYFMAEDKLEHKRILFNLLRDLNFFLLLAQSSNTHRHNWGRCEGYL